ncbi:uncharacterized protein LAESUDRAFT_683332 [Laetiporus sulphureus 93-53]|uniref:Uncharacterized protein n=1 Tax=Laetiporus sulphureus 93-53 TaxID=1314785 RepID=A0A165CZ01_9APHY|nr:uncharacterized protein LAESUDRAFT_683332 [Laetiporus sulphureus 93-53]KZT03780.1 hypothetical protein LAESUDRAFT_683332 [Laetiporus sulphureus 93-53]
MPLMPIRTVEPVAVSSSAALASIAYLPSHLTQILAQSSRSFIISHAMQHSLSLAFSHVIPAKLGRNTKNYAIGRRRHTLGRRSRDNVVFLSFFLGAAPWLVALYIF